MIQEEPPRLVRTDEGLELVYGSQRFKIPRLKHQAVFITVSNIATQYAYCEYKLHLDYMKGREITRNIVAGFYEHSRQLGGGGSFDFDIEPIPGHTCPVLINVGQDGEIYFNKIMSERWIGKLLSSTNKNRNYIVEPALVHVINNVPILAQPDLLILENDKPKIVLELKTTSGDPKRVKPQEITQVLMYKHMLNLLGLNIEYACILKLRRGVPFKLLDNIDKILSKLHDNTGDRTYIDRNVVLHKVSDDKLREDINKIVEWALGYWLYKRNPVPKPSPNKCRTCVHNRECTFKSLR